MTARKINPLTRCPLIGTPRTYFRAEGISDIGRSETQRAQAVRSEEAKNEPSSEEAVSSERERAVSLVHVSLEK
jgi:hypothetical protein